MVTYQKFRTTYQKWTIENSPPILSGMDTINEAKNGNIDALTAVIEAYAGSEEGDRAQIARIALWASLDGFNGDSAEDFARHAHRAVSLALMDADDHAWFTGLEFERVSRKLEALYAVQKAGDDSVYTRQRVARLEALQGALQGFPDSLAN